MEPNKLIDEEKCPLLPVFWPRFSDRDEQNRSDSLTGDNTKDNLR